MSTKIKDLPGSQSEEPPMQPNQPLPQQMQPQMQPPPQTIPAANQMPLPLGGPPVVQESNQTNIKADVKKRVRFSEKNQVKEITADGKPTDFVSFLRSEINEENLLLIGLLFVASNPMFGSYVKRLPVVGSFAGGNLVGSIVKVAILFVIFLLLKMYALPYIKL